MSDQDGSDRRIVSAFSASVTGRVQGVGFRWAARDEARRLGLLGWVRNEGDGSVSLFAQGPASRMESFERWLRRGPPGARIDSFRKIPADPDPSLSSFYIEL